MPAILAAAAVSGAVRPASADQLVERPGRGRRHQPKLQATQAQIETLTGQVNQADYELSQLQAKIAAGQAAIVKDQATVSKDKSQLRSQAIADYTNSDSGSQVTQMFSSNLNANGIRSEYSAIATGNVTTTIDRLHTAQQQLQANQSRAAAGERASHRGARRPGQRAAAGDAAGHAGPADAGRRQRQHPEPRATAAGSRGRGRRPGFPGEGGRRASPGQAAAQAQAAAQTAQSSTDAGSSSDSAASDPAATAPLPPLAPGAAGAVQAAEREVGVPYVWGGDSPSTGFDCSGLVMWAYAQVGISLPHYSGAQYEDTTHIPLADIEPGDLLFYGPGGSEHVAMYVGGGEMIEAPYTGASVWITAVRTGDDFAGVGRVVG